MDSQLVRASAWLATVFTHVRLDARVLSSVYVQLLSLFELLPAVNAHLRLLTCVGTLVNFQFGSSDKRGTTVIT